MKALFALKDGIQLVLASGSPRRRQFLEEWGVSFSIRPASSEPVPALGEEAVSYAVRSAAVKLESVSPESGELVLAADTVVACDGRILGKPKDDTVALEMLRCLSGRTHRVVTGVALAFPDGRRESFSETCRVTFAGWSDSVLAAYVQTGECRDKAGAYAIQGQGAFLVSSISGSWSTVVGLPESAVVRRLLSGGWMFPRSGL